jgi:hypothetical protein
MWWAAASTSATRNPSVHADLLVNTTNVGILSTSFAVCVFAPERPVPSKH